MPWVEIDLAQQTAEPRKRKLRLVADEDVDAALVAALRIAGMDVVTVGELGHKGRDDVDVYKLAYREKRALLTFNGRDYLNPSRFPFHSCAGLLWIDMPRADAYLAEAAFNIRELRWLGGWESKIRLKPQWEFDVWTPRGKERYRFIADRVEQWVEG